MAEMSCLQIDDANDAVSSHYNRNHHQRRRHHHHHSLSQILDSLPHWLQSDDDVSEPDFPSDAGFSVDVSVSDLSGEGLDLLERRSFVMDLFHQRVEQSQVTPLDDDYDGNRDMRGGSFELDFIGCDEHDGDDSFDGIRCLGMECEFESGSDSGDDEEKDKEIWGVDLNEEEEDAYVNDEEENDSVTIPLCWDSLRLEDLGTNNEEFEWEEVDDDDDDGGDDHEEAEVDDHEVAEEEAEYDNNSVSVSVSATISLEDLATGERRGYLGWEVLLNSRSLEFNLDDAESNMELYIGDFNRDEEDEDYLHTTEYEMLFEAEISSALGKPPASASFIKNLKVSLLTKEDVRESDGDDDAMCCAVCREEMVVGKEVAELPCRHKYHSECIVPWLGIRNTCPVCRFELPSDETEQGRFWRP